MKNWRGCAELNILVHPQIIRMASGDCDERWSCWRMIATCESKPWPATFLFATSPLSWPGRRHRRRWNVRQQSTSTRHSTHRTITTVKHDGIDRKIPSIKFVLPPLGICPLPGHRLTRSSSLEQFLFPFLSLRFPCVLVWIRSILIGSCPISPELLFPSIKGEMLFCLLLVHCFLPNRISLFVPFCAYQLDLEHF